MLEGVVATSALVTACGGSGASAESPNAVEIAAPDDGDSTAPPDRVVDDRRAAPEVWQPADARDGRGCTVERDVEGAWSEPGFPRCPTTLYGVNAVDSATPVGAHTPRPPMFSPDTRGYFVLALTKDARFAGSPTACCYDSEMPAPVVGRPLIRADRAATAPARSGTLGAVSNAQLGAFFLSAAADEHASVAAFADVTLQLMAHGAPLSLLSDVARAMSDEVRHAEVCYERASHFLGTVVTPGPLPEATTVTSQSLADLVRSTFLEGCVGETIAARMARAQASSAPDHVTRRILSGIAEDEERHAELAWKIVAWAFRADSIAAVNALEGALAQLKTQLGVQVDERAAERAGPLVSAVDYRALVTETLAEVVLPCADALLSSASRAA